MKKFYIRILGGNTHLVQRLADFVADGKAWERYELPCKAQNGSVSMENVWEVDVSVKDEIYRTRRSLGYQFIIYEGVDDETPHAIFVQSEKTEPKQSDPFKHSIPRSRKKGVISGESLRRRPLLRK